MLADWENNPAIENFREYLRIPSVHPSDNYGLDGCVSFLEDQAKSLGLPIKVITLVPNNPIVVMTWEGSDPSQPAIMINSHMDVVPVFAESWTYPPFSAHLTDDGKIYARGSQDMKCVGIQYLEAIRNLKKANVVLKRTVYISFMPDEETGGCNGMKKFISTDYFKSMKIGFALDEGMANPNNDFALFYGERSLWHIHFHCKGQSGHGSLLLPNTAGEKVQYLLNKFMEFRVEQVNLLESEPALSIGDVTTVNLTRLHGGVQTNVVPEELTIIFDVRLAVTVNHEAFEQKIHHWCNEAGGNITIDFERKNSQSPSTNINDTNPFWVAFKTATDEMNLTLQPKIFPAGTDISVLRMEGIPALGFSPINNTPVLLHDHDEYLHADTFLKGITIYEKLISAIANVDHQN